MIRAFHGAPAQSGGAVIGVVLSRYGEGGKGFRLLAVGQFLICGSVHNGRSGILFGIEQSVYHLTYVDVVLTEQALIARGIRAEEHIFEHFLQVDDVVEVLQRVRPESERAQVYGEQVVIYIQAQQHVLYAVDVGFELYHKVCILGVVKVDVHTDVQNYRGHIHIEHDVHGAQDVVKRDARGYGYVARDGKHYV